MLNIISRKISKFPYCDNATLDIWFALSRFLTKNPWNQRYHCDLIWRNIFKVRINACISTHCDIQTHYPIFNIWRDNFWKMNKKQNLHKTLTLNVILWIIHFEGFAFVRIGRHLIELLNTKILHGEYCMQIRNSIQWKNNLHFHPSSLEFIEFYVYKII